MNVKMIRENSDGSADFEFNLSPEEMELMLINGIRAAILAGMEQAKAWKAELPDLLDDDQAFE